MLAFLSFYRCVQCLPNFTVFVFLLTNTSGITAVIVSQCVNFHIFSLDSLGNGLHVSELIACCHQEVGIVSEFQHDSVL